jgi:hypothetical protein
MISCPTASCQGDRCPSFSGLPAIARPITPLRQFEKRHAVDHCMLVCFSAPHEADGSAPGTGRPHP